jgi:hypothetical protein
LCYRLFRRLVPPPSHDLKGDKRIMSFNLHTFTILHVIISLIGIGSGFVVVIGLLTSRRLDGWTALFLVSTVATSGTGFFFPFHGFTPAIGVGIISLIVLAIAIIARYLRHLAGVWRKIYVIISMVALYLNFFVLIVQSFQKIPALKAMAPTQSEPPFLVAQVVALVLFVVLAIAAAIRFRSEPLRPTVART